MSNVRPAPATMTGYRIDALIGAIDRHEQRKADVSALQAIGLDAADIAEIETVARERGISVGAAAADMIRCVIGVMGLRD